jgi:hypothetical protein
VVDVPRYTLPPYGPRGFEAETIFIADDANNDFLADSSPAIVPEPFDSELLVRWLFILRYPEGISKENGESWYLGTHTQEAKYMLGLRRYRSWGAQARRPELRDVAPLKWDRLTELAFADWDAWEEGAVTKMPRWTPPPYGNPGFLSETVFIGEEPEYDFLKDMPRVP